MAIQSIRVDRIKKGDIIRIGSRHHKAISNSRLQDVQGKKVWRIETDFGGLVFLEQEASKKLKVDRAR